MSEVLHLVVPGPLDQRTGGYLYDARMAAGLGKLGWTVVVHSLEGEFPRGDAHAEESLRRALAGVPDGGRVLIDGLAMGSLPGPVAEHAGRVRLLGLVHHPLADETGLDAQERERLARLETEALAACAGVIVTSPFTAARLGELGVPRARVRSVLPGTDPARPSVGPGPGEAPRLLCVGTVIPRKGQDVLVRALARLQHMHWSCVCAGSLDRAPEYAEHVLALTREVGLAERISFPGECRDRALEDLFQSASLFVLPSYYEGYGMALTEALARGLPVVSTTGGAVPHTVPGAAGILLPPGDDAALADALGHLLAGAAGTARRAKLAIAARQHALKLPSWDRAAGTFAKALLELERSGLTLASDAFAADWLALREGVDHRARPVGLLEPLERWCVERAPDRASAAAGRALKVVDLGSGTGSNLRYLAPRLPGPSAWTLVDHDAALLARADLLGVARERGVARVERVRGDLAREGLDAVRGADVATASALLDLVSEPWLDGLVRACAEARCAALFALSWDGAMEWSGPADRDDALALAAFSAHQRRDKGVGPALGPTAAPAAARLFQAAGYRTSLAQSPWRLGPDERELTGQLLDGWEQAAVEQRPDEAERLHAWADRRRRSLEGAFGLVVGHLDLLALPER